MPKAKKRHEPKPDSTTAPSDAQLIQLELAGLPDHVGKFNGISLELSEHITLPDWKAVGVTFSRISAGTSWALGDWLNVGAKFDTKADRKGYKEAIAATGLDYGRLRTIASVAKRFPPAMRRPSLSFEHHRLLAPVKKADKIEELMDRIDEEKLSTAALRPLLPKQPKKKGKPKTAEQTFTKEVADGEKWLQKIRDLTSYVSTMPAHVAASWAQGTDIETLSAAFQAALDRATKHNAKPTTENNSDEQP